MEKSARNRIRETQKKHEMAFQEEMHLIEKLKPSGYEAFRFYRHFVRTTLWPPLHSRAEVDRYLDHYRNQKSCNSFVATKDNFNH